MNILPWVETVRSGLYKKQSETILNILNTSTFEILQFAESF